MRSATRRAFDQPSLLEYTKHTYTHFIKIQIYHTRTEREREREMHISLGGIPHGYLNTTQQAHKYMRRPIPKHHGPLECKGDGGVAFLYTGICFRE